MERTFEEMLRVHRHRVYSYAFHFLGRREEAEDVTQEVFLRLWRHLPRLDSAAVPAWLTTVTRNAAYDTLRRRQGAARSLDETAASDLASADGDPHAEAEGADFARLLRRAVAELREPYRSVLILREIQEMKYGDIAAALDLPLNTVKTYVHRGRRQLRRTLAEVCPDAGK